MLIEITQYNVDRIRRVLKKELPDFKIEGKDELGYFTGFVAGVLDLYFKKRLEEGK